MYSMYMLENNPYPTPAVGTAVEDSPPLLLKHAAVAELPTFDSTVPHSLTAWL
jgi:hypothetical protein